VELRHLEYFMVLCEELHFTRASEKLGISQPTLSHQIKALENEVGINLFDRRGKKISLTEAGSVLRNQCGKIMSNVKSTYEQINELKYFGKSNLIVGTLSGEINYLVAQTLSEFHKMFPNINIKLIVSDGGIQDVLHNKLDMVITDLPFDEDQVRTVPLYKEEFYLVVPKNHELAERDKIDLEEIGKYRLIICLQNHHCRQIIDKAFQSLGINLTPIIESNTIESILSLVRDGVGFSILSKTLLSLYKEENIHRLLIVNPNLYRRIGIVYHKDKHLGHSGSRIINLLQEQVKLLVQTESIKTC